ncbi:hypothetical protein L2E82_34089 [Cichorium intybus]|uniref:Uncharacterized protein n=1 Tax=Cichorium intybus TaxID=13427 RepID=A0ACB9BLV3_CICIN|nr:hypothetical protein L2E82_34089 [Cichorium intybus]
MVFPQLSFYFLIIKFDEYNIELNSGDTKNSSIGGIIVTVPHILSLPDQAKLAEQLQQEGVDIIQTEGGKCSNPSKPGVLGLIEKIPVMCASGLSAVTAPMAIIAGASRLGVGSAINNLNDNYDTKQILGFEPSEDQLAASLKISKADSQVKQVECKLVMSNVFLVMLVAQKYANMGAEIGDLIQEGLIGLLRGIEKYDSSRGFKISTYVYWWIQQ